MYSMKPIIDSTQSLDGRLSSMYDMKSVYEQRDGAPVETAAKLGTSEMSSLEQRQNKVLAQLNELKRKLDSMQAAQKKVTIIEPTKLLGKTKTVPGLKPGLPPRAYVEQRMLYTEKYGPAKKLSKSTIDVVINANPNSIPYSLRAIKSMWMNRLHISYTSHTHSTISELPDAAKKFSECLKWSHLVPEESPFPIIFVTLIWKDVKQAEIISGATNYVPIIGEANILRYFHRIGPNEYVRPMFPLDISVNDDAALDAVSQLHLVKDAKARLQLWKQLNTLLGKKKFYGDDLLTIADMAVSSSVQNFGKDKIPEPLLRHYESVNLVVGYDTSKSFY